MCKDKGRGIGLTWSLHPFSDRLERTYGIWDFELARCCDEMHYGTFFRDAITSVCYHKIALETGGAFHSAKTSGLNFRQLQERMERHSPKFPKTGQPREVYPNFRNFFPGGFLSIQLCSQEI